MHFPNFRLNWLSRKRYHVCPCLWKYFDTNPHACRVICISVSKTCLSELQILTYNFVPSVGILIFSIPFFPSNQCPIPVLPGYSYCLKIILSFFPVVLILVSITKKKSKYRERSFGIKWAWVQVGLSQVINVQSGTRCLVFSS